MARRIVAVRGKRGVVRYADIFVGADGSGFGFGAGIGQQPTRKTASEAAGTSGRSS